MMNILQHLSKWSVTSTKNTSVPIPSGPIKTKATLGFIAVVYMLLGIQAMQAAAISSNAVTGNWSATGTWAGGVVPVSGDTVTIVAGAIVTIDVTITMTGTVSVATGGALINGSLISSTFNTVNGTTTGSFVNNGTVTVNTQLNMNSGGFTNAATGTLIYAGSGAIGTITASAVGNIVEYTRAGTQPVKDINYSTLRILGSGTKTLTAFGNRTIGATLTVGSGATLRFGSNTAAQTHTLTVTGATVIDGTLDFITGTPGATPFPNTGLKTFTGGLTINVGGTVTESDVTIANYSFSGTVTNNGTLTAATGTHTFTTGATLAGTFSIPTVAIGGTVTNTANLTVTTALSGSILSNTTGTLNLQGASTLTTLTNGASGTVTVSGSGSSATSLANFTNAGTVNFGGSGTITGINNNATVNLTSSGTITSFNNNATGTLNISAASPSITTLTATSVGNIVNYNAGVNQTIIDVAYNNLNISGAAIKSFTLAANRTIVNLDVTSGTTLAFTGAFNVNNTGNFNNAGTITAAGTHTFSAAGTKTNSGTMTIPTFVVTGGAGSVAFTNTGTLTVNTDLQCNSSPSVFNNTGTVTIVALLSGTGGTFNNNTGGTLNFTSSGVGTNCSIQTVTNAGTIVTSNVATITTATGNFTNTNIIDLNSTGDIAGITNNATVNLANSGTITAFNNATASSILNISDLTVPTITTLTTSVAGNTVTYNGLGNQTVKDQTYSNLTISGTGTKTFNLATGRSIVNLTVNSGSTLSLTESAASTFSVTNNLTNDGTITSTVTGNHNLNTGGTKTNTGTITIPTLFVTGVTLANSGTLTIANLTVSGTVTNTGTATVSTILSGAGTFNNNATGILNFTSNVGGSNSTITTITNAGTINTSNVARLDTPLATFTNTGAIAVGSTGTILGITNNSPGTITTNSSGNITTINNNTGATVTITATGTIASIANSGGTVDFNGTGTVTGITNTTSGIVNFNGTGTASSITNTSTVNVNSSGGAITVLTNNAAGTVNIADSAAIGTLNNATATSTVNINAVSPSIASFTVSASGNTVNYNRSGNQSIIDVPYNTINVLGSGTKTVTLLGNKTYVNLDVDSGATLAASGNAAGRTLTVTGTFSNDGTITSDANVKIVLTTAAKTNAGTMNVSELEVNAITFTNSGTITSAKLAAQSGGIVTNTGTVTVSESLSGASPAVFNNNAAGTLNFNRNTLASDNNSIIHTINNAGTINTTNVAKLNHTLLSNTGILNLNSTGAITTITNTSSGTINLTNSGLIGTLTNGDGTLNISNLSGPSFTTFTMGTNGTVNYNGAGDQTVLPPTSGTFSGTLILSGSGNKTINTVSGGTLTSKRLTITSPANAQVTNTDVTAKTLFIDGIGRFVGNWGATGTPGIDYSNAAFTGTTGYIKVTDDARLSPTAVLAVSNSPITYNASNVATVSITSAVFGITPVPGTVSNIKYNGSLTVPTAIGTYTITATFVPDDQVTYSNVPDIAAGSFVVNPASLTITANDQAKCPGTTFTFTGAEFTNGSLFNSDTVASVTLTSSGAGPGASSGSYSIVPSSAIGTGLTNYTISYVNGTFTVNPLPTATMSVDNASGCLNILAPVLTFTGANGTGTVQYKFNYTINGTPLSVTTAPGSSIYNIIVPNNSIGTVTYALTSVEDVNSTCSASVSVPNVSVVISRCTRVRPLQCGLTLPALDTPIQVSPATGATQYRFEVTRIDTNTIYPLITSSTYFFSPATKIPGGLLYGKSYSIRAQLFNGSWLAFGPACTVTAPPQPVTLTSKVRSFQCGLTLNNVDTSIEAIPVYLATQYRFEVTPQGGSTIEITTPNYYFSLTGTTGLAAYNKAYAIRVNAFSGGVWIGYGDTCTVTTPNQPATKLFTSQCGATFNNLTFTLNAGTVPLATKYRFRVVNGLNERVAEVTRSYIVPSDLAGGYSNNTIYTVDVATLYNGLWSNYGPACTVTTPFIRMASRNIDSDVFEVKAFPNPFARHFSLDIQSSSDDLVQVQVYDMLGRALEVQKATVSEFTAKEIGTNFPSGVYNIIVSQGNKVKSVRLIKR